MKKSSVRELYGKIRLADSSGLEEYDFKMKTAVLSKRPLFYRKMQ